MAENKSVLQKLKEPDYRNSFLTGALIGAGGVLIYLQGMPKNSTTIVAAALTAFSVGVIYAEKQSRENPS